LNGFGRFAADGFGIGQRGYALSAGPVSDGHAAPPSRPVAGAPAEPPPSLGVAPEAAVPELPEDAPEVVPAVPPLPPLPEAPVPAPVAPVPVAPPAPATPVVPVAPVPPDDPDVPLPDAPVAAPLDPPLCTPDPDPLVPAAPDPPLAGPPADPLGPPEGPDEAELHDSASAAHPCKKAFDEIVRRMGTGPAFWAAGRPRAHAPVSAAPERVSLPL
jgi:hypothetical protein